MAVSLPSYQLSESATYPSNADSFSLIKITHNAKKTLIHEKKKKKLYRESVFFFFSSQKMLALCYPGSLCSIYCIVYLNFLACFLSMRNMKCGKI